MITEVTNSLSKHLGYQTFVSDFHDHIYLTTRPNGTMCLDLSSEMSFDVTNPVESFGLIIKALQESQLIEPEIRGKFPEEFDIAIKSITELCEFAKSRKGID